MVISVLVVKDGGGGGGGGDGSSKTAGLGILLADQDLVV